MSKERRQNLFSEWVNFALENFLSFTKSLFTPRKALGQGHVTNLYSENSGNNLQSNGKNDTMVFALRESPYMRIENANISFELYNNPNFSLHVSCGRNHPCFFYFSRQKIQGTYNVKEREGGGEMNHTPFLWGWTKEYNTRDNKQKHESLGSGHPSKTMEDTRCFALMF